MSGAEQPEDGAEVSGEVPVGPGTEPLPGAVPGRRTEPLPEPSSGRAMETPPRHSEGGPGTAPYESGPADAALSVPVPGRALLERYTVLGPLGQGNMGVVLSVYDARLDRRVALKLLRSWSGAGEQRLEEQGRFVREAQAMARLSHPNVVAVYDAGQLENGTLYIAMEHVEGQTLRRWQKQRGWREVLEKYLAAGKGLAAAHAAGLIHHDFKPDNVLVGVDGRVRVTDFGLARLEPVAEPAGGAEPALAAGARPPEPEERLTARSSQWMGTPFYMAEEQFRGQRGDARSDLYAFCAALYEGLYGEVPFRGDTVSELRQAQQAGMAAPPENTEVPQWVGRTVLRGLHCDPARRPQTMGALLRQLEDDPAVRRRGRWVRGGVAGLTLVLGALAVWGWAGQQQPRCGGLEQRLRGIWDETVEARVRQRLVATGVAYAPATAERVAQGLEAYAGAWVKQRVQLCERAREEGPSSATGLVLLEETCLERRRSQLRALTELLSREPEPELVTKAVQAVQELPPVEYCSDAKALTAAVPPPEDPGVRAKVEALQEQLDRVEALLEAGQYKEGLSRADGLVPQVEPVGYPPVLARALFLSARLREETGDYQGAEQWLHRAMEAAARGRDAGLLARASSSLMMVVGVRQKRAQEALLLRPALESLVEWADDDLIRASAASSLGSALLDSGKLEEARRMHERALELRQKVLGPEHPRVADSLNNLGVALDDLNQREEARQLHLRALAIREKVLGPEHPQVAISLNNLGIVLREMNRFEEARQVQTRALELRQKALGPEHPRVADSLNSLATILQDMGRFEEARSLYVRSLAIREKTLGPEHLQVASSLTNLGLVLREMNKPEEALRVDTRALALKEKLLGPEHPIVGDAQATLGADYQELGRYQEALEILSRALSQSRNALGLEHKDIADLQSHIGDALRDLGRHAEAREKYLSAMAIQDKVLPPDDSDRLCPLLGMGKLLLAQHRAAEAVPLLERGLKVALPNKRALVQFQLARALGEARMDPRRALELATEARESLLRSGREADAEQAARWIRRHALPPRP